jgi:hypothetical protein
MGTKEAVEAWSAEPSVYAQPRTITDLQDCLIYHTMDIPGYGLVEGEWDLRGGVDAYLGGVDVGGKRVLELGTASGFLCFQMERRGARVVAYDLSEHQSWDLVPFAASFTPAAEAARKQLVRMLNNGYWLAHRAHQSSARVVYGTIYEVPKAIGAVDVATFGCILLHIQNPFLALANTLRLVRETVVISEPDWHFPLTLPPAVPPPPALPINLQRKRGRFLDWLLRGRLRRHVQQLREHEEQMRQREEQLRRFEATLQTLPLMTFKPNHRYQGPTETWWDLRPALLCQFLGVLGFEDTQVNYHTQQFQKTLTRMFTVVGRRTHSGILALHAPDA